MPSARTIGTSKCSSSVTPHPFRRGYITRLLKTGVTIDVVSDRCNVSPVVIDEHYDVRTDDKKIRQRQEAFCKALDESDGWSRRIQFSQSI